MKHTSHQQGQTLVEFAVALPLLTVLLFGIIQYGLVFSGYTALRHATFEAARAGSLSGGTNDPKPVVSQAIQPMLNPAYLGTVTSTDITLGGAPAVKITANYNLPLIMKFVVPGFYDSYPLTSTATYRKN